MSLTLDKKIASMTKDKKNHSLKRQCDIKTQFSDVRNVGITRQNF